jgi:hypothetical protein
MRDICISLSSGLVGYVGYTCIEYCCFYKVSVICNFNECKYLMLHITSGIIGNKLHGVETIPESCLGIGCGTTHSLYNTCLKPLQRDICHTTFNNFLRGRQYAEHAEIYDIIFHVILIADPSGHLS